MSIRPVKQLSGTQTFMEGAGVKLERVSSGSATRLWPIRSCFSTISAMTAPRIT